MNKDQLQEKLSLSILYASLRGKFEISEALQKYDLTFMPAAVLCLLEPGSPLPMNALSSFLGCAPSYITGVIDQLVAGSFVTREEWPQDRRIKAITLTAQGTELRATLLKVAMKARLPQIEKLSLSELRDATNALDKAASDTQSSLWPTLPS